MFSGVDFQECQHLQQISRFQFLEAIGFTAGITGITGKRDAALLWQMNSRPSGDSPRILIPSKLDMKDFQAFIPHRYQRLCLILGTCIECARLDLSTLLQSRCGRWKQRKHVPTYRITLTSRQTFIPKHRLLVQFHSGFRRARYATVSAIYQMLWRNHMQRWRHAGWSCRCCVEIQLCKLMFDFLLGDIIGVRYLWFSTKKLKTTRKDWECTSRVC